MKYHKNPVIHLNRKLWLKQLRNPESTKAYRRLENWESPNERCCLGHACHALGIERVVRQDWSEMQAGYICSVSYDEERSVLSNRVAEMLDITRMGQFRNSYRQDEDAVQVFTCLTDLNDQTDLEPHQIADIIEEMFVEDKLKSFEEDQTF